MTTYGIGEFRMRNGGKAVVTDKDRHLTFPLAGYSGDQRLSWCRNGKRHADGGQSDFDLIGPWVEPAPDPIDTEMQAWLAEVEAGLGGTTPGDWTVTFEEGYCDTQICAESDKRKRIANIHPQKHDEDADHIARTNPKRMAELIAWLKSKGVMK